MPKRRRKKQIYFPLLFAKNNMVERKQIIHQIIEQIKNHPEYDFEVVKEEFETLMQHGLLEELFAIYQQHILKENKKGNTNKINSTIAYLLGITSQKPNGKIQIKKRRTYARAGWPDIDIDMCYERRSEVEQYVIEKYGRENVANIGNVGKLEIRSAIRKAIKVLDPSNIYNKENDWGKKFHGKDPNFQLENNICETLPMIMKKEDGSVIKDLKEAYNTYPEFKKYMDFYPDVYDVALAITKTVASFSRHAAAWILSPIPLKEICPLHVTARVKNKHDIATQFTMEDVEAIGLIKMDFLGLSTETAIAKAEKTIKDSYGISLNSETVPKNDKKTLQLLNSGKTIGVFQAESPGMQNTLKKIGIDSIHDLIVCIAMFRPGPMQYIDEYAARKRGEQAVTYEHPIMESILKQTHGIAIFQELVMRVFVELAGLTNNDGYTLVKGCAKKKKHIVDSMKEKFVRGCIVNGIDKKVIKSVWNSLKKHSGYSFNLSHSAIYGIKSYYTAYLKSHFPTEFMVSRLSIEYRRKSEKHMKAYREEIQRMDYRILPPDVNKSNLDWQIIDDKTVRESLLVKGIGIKAAQEIINCRPYNGPDVFYNFTQRVGPAINSKVIEAMHDGKIWTHASKKQVIKDFDMIKDDMKKSRSRGGADIFGEQFSKKS